MIVIARACLYWVVAAVIAEAVTWLLDLQGLAAFVLGMVAGCVAVCFAIVTDP